MSSVEKYPFRKGDEFETDNPIHPGTPEDWKREAEAQQARDEKNEAEEPSNNEGKEEQD